jgi:transcriptional regulator with XRE-family HTH domain
MISTIILDVGHGLIARNLRPQSGIGNKKQEICGLPIALLSFRMTGVHTVKRLGQNICKLRVDARRTQNQLSEEAQIDRSFLQRIEAGKSSPTAIILVRIKRALNCSWDDIFFGVSNNTDAMVSDSKPVPTQQPSKFGGINRLALEQIVADLDSLIREAVDADKAEIQELQEAQAMLKRLMTRPSPA